MKSAAEASFQKAVALIQEGNVEAAVAGYRETLRLDPAHHVAWINLSTALQKQANYAAAAACSMRALSFAPQNPFYLMNHGNNLECLDRLDEALAAHAAAVRLKPDDALIRRNHCVVLREAGRYEETLAAVREALQRWPNDTQFLWEEALTYLQLGRYEEGWKAFDIRWKLPGMQERSSSKAKRWHGEDLAGKTILVYEEQGFGDSILCSRYIPLLHQRGAKIILECKKPLHRLFSALPGVVQLAERGVMAGYDYHVPMMSLPGLFNTTLSTIPAPAALHIPAMPSEAARLLALGQGRLKVGIVWSGSAAFKKNHKRSVPLERFLPFAEIPGVQLYSLQKGPPEKELADMNAGGLIIDLAPHLGDFADTAAILKGLGLVIMTDSSVAHLAGSLGVPVWNLLNANPYWLYLTGRDDSPWYPSLRLFRQPKAGDWDSVFRKALAALPKAFTRS